MKIITLLIGFTIFSIEIKSCDAQKALTQAITQEDVKQLHELLFKQEIAYDITTVKKAFEPKIAQWYKWYERAQEDVLGRTQERVIKR